MSSFQSVFITSEKITQTIIHDDKKKMSNTKCHLNHPAHHHHHNNQNQNQNQHHHPHHHNHNNNNNNHNHNHNHNNHHSKHHIKGNVDDFKNKNKFIGGDKHKDKNIPVEINLQNEKNIIVNLPYNSCGWKININNN